MKGKNKAFKPRNPVAMSPLLRKGGPHDKGRKAERAAARREIRNILASRRGGAAPVSQIPLLG